MTNAARPYAVGVVLAAGMGTRIGADGNKAYLRLAGRSMASWSVETVAALPEIGRTVLVFRRGERALAEHTMAQELPTAAVEFVEGGDSRHASELNALRYLRTDIDSGAIDVVLIHDAARPLAGSGMMLTALSIARRFGGAVPALRASGAATTGPTGKIEGVTAPGSLVRVQTPQAFRATALLRAHLTADAQGFEGTDTSSCVERFTDTEIRTFGGAESNLKVTYPRDMILAERMLLDLTSPDGLR